MTIFALIFVNHSEYGLLLSCSKLLFLDWFLNRLALITPVDGVVKLRLKRNERRRYHKLFLLWWNHKI